MLQLHFAKIQALKPVFTFAPFAAIQQQAMIVKVGFQNSLIELQFSQYSALT
jgi:hypothetical protein